MANEIGVDKIKVYYKATSTAESYTQIVNVDSFPDLGGSKDKIEVTNLSDGCHRYIDGIDNYGDTLTFTAYYDKAEFAAVNALKGVVFWKVEINDDETNPTTCTFSGTVSVQLGGNSVGANAMKYNINITPNSAMVFA